MYTYMYNDAYTYVKPCTRSVHVYMYALCIYVCVFVRVCVSVCGCVFYFM